MANGASHSETNKAGSKGIPMGSEESVNVASKKITTKGFPAGKTYGQSQAADVKPYLDYFAKAESNPTDRFLNDENTKAMLDEELAQLEQNQHEGRFMKGLHELLKKKNRDFGSVMEYIVKENPNDAAAVMGGEQAIPGAIEQQGLQQSQEAPVASANPQMSPPMEGKGMPMAKDGIRINPENRGKFTASANRAGMGVQAFANKVLSAPEGQYSATQRKRANFARNAARWKHQQGGMVDPSTMDPKSRYEFNMRNNYQMGGGISPEMMQSGGPMGASGPMDPMGMQGAPMDPSMMGGGMGSELPPELLEAQGQGMDPMQEMAMAQQEQGMPMEPEMDGQEEAPDVDMGLQVAQQIMEALPTVFKAEVMDPEVMQANPNDIFSEGFEKELQSMGMSKEEIEQVHLSEVHTGKIGQILGGMVQDASPEGKAPGAASVAGPEQMAPQGPPPGMEGMDPSMMQGAPEMMQGQGMEGQGMEVPPEMMQEQAMAEVQEMMAYGGRYKAQNGKGKGEEDIDIEQYIQDQILEDFKNKQGLRDKYQPDPSAKRGPQYRNIAPPYDEFGNYSQKKVQESMEKTYLNDLLNQGLPSNLPMYLPEGQHNLAYGGRVKYQDGKRTPGQMDVAMAQQRAAQNVSYMPNINIENIDPASFESSVPNPQLQGPYKGFESRFRKDEYDIPQGTLEERDPRELASKEPYKTESESYSSLGVKAGKTSSGREKALHENVAKTLEGMFKGQEAVGEPGSKGILTEQGRQYFAMQGMTPEAMDELTYENLSSSQAWKDYIGPEMADAYKTLKREGEGAPTMNKIKRTQYENPMHATIDILSDALSGGENFRDLEKDVQEHINDFLQSPSGEELTKEDIINNKSEVAKKFNEYNTFAVNKHKYKKYYDIVNSYGSGVEQSKTKESLLGVKTDVDKGRVPLEAEDIDYGKPGKGMSFSQAFAHNRKAKNVVFKWNGKTYTTKRFSELTPKEKEAYAKSKAKPTKPTTETKPIKFTTPGGKLEVARKGSGFAKHASGEDILSQPVQPSGGKYEGGFDYEHTQRELVPLGKKQMGGRVSGIRNGQYLKFQKGGKTHKGTVTNYNEETGDFDLV